MKKIHWIRAQFYYYTGDITCKVMEYLDTDISASILYPIYSHCMVKSMLISDKHDLKIWTK